MKTKTCSTCNETKDTSEFYKGSRYKDGYRGQCKACTYRIQKKYNQSPKGVLISRASVKKWQENNQEKRKAYRKRYYEERGREYFRVYYKTRHGKNIRNDAVKKYRKTRKGKAAVARYISSNREKRQAKSAVNNAISKNRIPHISTQKCIDCDRQAEHYHHWSYERRHWLDVEPLCRQCHADRHKSA